MQTIVLSGINLFEGGTLSIYHDCLRVISESQIWKNNQIIAFVHKKELFEKYKDVAEFVELPKSRKSYFKRLYYEYFYFYWYSRKKHIDIWLSLHDITPKVKADRIYTYCHNPAPFAKKNITKLKYSCKFTMFTFFYKYLYRINIKSATALIVQQDWIRKEFFKMFPVKKIIVARPATINNKRILDRSQSNRRKVFLYVSYPRYFKNFEILLQASERLENRGDCNFETWITIDGTENRYSRELRQKYRHLKTVKWLGILPRNLVFQKYEYADILVFPSMLETWGLSISEFKSTGKPMLLADLPYAYEALGEYDRAEFFNPDDASELEKCMYKVLKGNMIFKKRKKMDIDDPYADSWEELFEIIMHQ